MAQTLTIVDQVLNRRSHRDRITNRFLTTDKETNLKSSLVIAIHADHGDRSDELIEEASSMILNLSARPWLSYMPYDKHSIDSMVVISAKICKIHPVLPQNLF